MSRDRPRPEGTWGLKTNLCIKIIVSLTVDVSTIINADSFGQFVSVVCHNQEALGKQFIQVSVARKKRIGKGKNEL